MTTIERMRRLNEEEREEQWATYRAIVDRHIDGKPNPHDHTAIVDLLGLLGVANAERALDVFEGHVKARKHAMKVKAEIAKYQKDVEDQQRKIVALNKPANMSKAKTLEEQAELTKGKEHKLKVLNHGIGLDTDAGIRAQVELQRMVRDWMNLLKDMAPS